MTEWFDETLYPGWGQRFKIEAVLAREHSPYQDIAVLQTTSHGRMLVLDGNVQVTEADEFVYQEMITHVPLLCHGAAKRVLIIGAGDGGVLRRVLQHRPVEQVTMVEIDGAVIDLAKRFLPAIGGDAWADPRATVIVGDGIHHVADAQTDAYDVIIVDSTDPVGVGEVLFTDAFYADCARILGRSGILVNQCGVPFMQADELRTTSHRRRAHFAQVSAYVVAVPTYVGGFMALGLASQAAITGHATDTIHARAEQAGIIGQTQYWTPSVQTAAFQLPPYVASALYG